MRWAVAAPFSIRVLGGWFCCSCLSGLRVRRRERSGYPKRYPQRDRGTFQRAVRIFIFIWSWAKRLESQTRSKMSPNRPPTATCAQCRASECYC
ncbi:hypothetical protein OF83DRAFT_726878 [Amylostereum chailletii]|nr:hypothetical protein OF83DRAFT_726878 [Amylostereum chailletii]